MIENDGGSEIGQENDGAEVNMINNMTIINKEKVEKLNRIKIEDNYADEAQHQDGG